MINGLIDYRLALTLSIGMIIGGYLGARTAVKKGDKFVKLIIILMQLIVVAKLLIF